MTIYFLVLAVNGVRCRRAYPVGPFDTLDALRWWRDRTLSTYTTRDRVWCHITPVRS